MRPSAGERVRPAVTAARPALAGLLSIGLALRQRPSAGFWACAVAGCALVMTFAAWKGGGRLVAADGWLLLAVLSTSIAYVAGARVSGAIPAQQVICWVVVGSLPLTLPATLWWWPTGTTPSITAWGGLLYVGLFSMWLGFFAWGGFKSEAQQRLQWMEVEG